VKEREKKRDGLSVGPERETIREEGDDGWMDVY